MIRRDLGHKGGSSYAVPPAAGYGSAPPAVGYGAAPPAPTYVQPSYGPPIYYDEKVGAYTDFNQRIKSLEKVPLSPFFIEFLTGEKNG